MYILNVAVCVLLSLVAILSMAYPIYRYLANSGSRDFNSSHSGFGLMLIIFFVLAPFVGAISLLIGGHIFGYVFCVFLLVMFSFVGNLFTYPTNNVLPPTRCIIGWYRTGLGKWNFSQRWKIEILRLGFWIFSNFKSGFRIDNIDRSDKQCGCTVIFKARGTALPESFEYSIIEQTEAIKKVLNSLSLPTTKEKIVLACSLKVANCPEAEIQIKKPWIRV